MSRSGEANSACFYYLFCSGKVITTFTRLKIYAATYL